MVKGQFKCRHRLCGKFFQTKRKRSEHQEVCEYRLQGKCRPAASPTTGRLKPRMNGKKALSRHPSRTHSVGTSLQRVGTFLPREPDLCSLCHEPLGTSRSGGGWCESIEHVIIPCVPTEPHTESCSVVVHKKCPLGTDLSLQKWVDAQLANRTEIQKGAKGCWKVVRCSAPSHVQLECSMCAHLSTY